QGKHPPSFPDQAGAGPGGGRTASRGHPARARGARPGPRRSARTPGRVLPLLGRLHPPGQSTDLHQCSACSGTPGHPGRGGSRSPGALRTAGSLARGDAQGGRRKRQPAPVRQRGIRSGPVHGHGARRDAVGACIREPGPVLENRQVGHRPAETRVASRPRPHPPPTGTGRRRPVRRHVPSWSRMKASQHILPGIPKLPARFAPIVMPLLLSLLMSAIVSLISTIKAGGLAPGLLPRWLGAWGLSWSIAFPVLLLVLPVVRRITAMLVRAP